MSRVRQPNKSPNDKRSINLETSEGQDEMIDGEGRMEMLHLQSEAVVETPSSGSVRDSF